VPARPPRSLADDLRGRDDQALARLVAARPDLIHPVPADLAALALRAGSPGSVASALRRYDQLTLQVVLAAALASSPTTTRALVASVVGPLAESVGATQARVRVSAAVTRLRDEGLLWGSDRVLHLVGAARDLLVPADRGPAVGALDPVVARLAADPDTLHALVAAAPAGARAALDRLLAGPLVGTVADARRIPDASRSAVDWMLTEHLVVPFGSDRVVVPAEVAAVLRGGPVPAADLGLQPPAPLAPPPDPVRVESGAVGAALDVLHAVAELGATWTLSPPARLRTGGIAQRDLTRTARALGMDEARTTLVVEIATAAGLLAPDSHEVVTVLPTASFDRWLADPPAQRMAELLLAWRDMPRSADPDQRPLAPEGAAPLLPDLRFEVLAVLASEPGAWRDDEVLAGLRWRAPRREDPARAGQALLVLQHLRALGLLVAGATTSAALALQAGDRPALVAALAAHLPAQVDTLVMQGDLTATVPGLPSPGLAALMRQAATPESVGAASVYRFSADTVRAALDAGRTARELLAELGRRGQVPQPLAYLIEDVARRHAALRIGSAGTYLRCDDPVELAGILADPRAASLGLQALSESVLVSALPAEIVLERLRELGRSPQPEVDGALASPPVRRARSRPDPDGAMRVSGSPPRVTPALAAAAVRAMRASDRGGEPRAAVPPTPGSGAVHPVPVTTPADVVAALRAAIATEATVWIGYADPSGVAGDRRLQPLRLAGGYLTALDLRTEAISSFALARITGVEPG
jgi:hypothetical protein